MTDKSRRNVDREIRLSETQMRQPGMEEMAEAEATPSLSSSQESQLAEEYRYVVADLRRIAVIAAVMLVVLIGLALLLA
jgi:hypothetical protein